MLNVPKKDAKNIEVGTDEEDERACIRGLLSN